MNKQTINGFNRVQISRRRIVYNFFVEFYLFWLLGIWKAFSSLCSLQASNLETTEVIKILSIDKYPWLTVFGRRWIPSFNLQMAESFQNHTPILMIILR